ncbi:MAG: redox-sensing transcriptional repressor Rex [Candidatus Zixiibacteriota bacterium]
MNKVSDSTVGRLSMYYRSLLEFEKKGYKIVSSNDLAKTEKLTPAQVRKDLSSFGSFGTRGLGYPARELKEKIAKILGLDRSWNVALVGVGNVGSALVSYKEFQKQGFNIKVLFDNDLRKISKSHKGITVSDVKNLAEELKKNKIDMVILAVPAQSVQEVADRVVSAGVKSILNFAPVQIKVPEDVVLRSVNMAMELEHLSFYLTNKRSIIRS